MKEQEFTIDIPVFNYRVIVVITNSISASRDARDELLGETSHKLNKYVDGLHSYNEEEPDSYIFITPRTTNGVIAHEVFHVIWRVFEWVGAKLDNETIAYHLSYIVDEIDEKRKMLRKTKKNSSAKNSKKNIEINQIENGNQ